MNGRLTAVRLLAACGGGAAFLIAASIFLARDRPTATDDARADGALRVRRQLFASESLVKATPILLCALAVILPARLGLITVGGEGQLYFGALTGTAVVVKYPNGPDVPAVACHAAGRRDRRCVLERAAGFLRARFNVNETISTLLMNYVAVLLVNYAVYGAWKDPASLGWPASIAFPPAATVPSLFGTRVHLGLRRGV